MSSILREDQYFDNEADFCVVWNEDSKAEIEQIFLDHRISYFVKEEPKPWYRKLLSFKRYPDAYVIRINSRDIARAAQLVEGIEDVEITGRIPRRRKMLRTRMKIRMRTGSGLRSTIRGMIWSTIQARIRTKG